MNDLEKTRKCIYSLQYHLIIIVKYRKDVFINKIIVSDMKKMCNKIASDFDVKILEMECGTDHLHILFRSKPTLDMTKFINILKGHSSRGIRKKHKDFLKDKLWGDHFWSPTYFIATTGNVTLDILKSYIEKQRKDQE